MKKVLLTLLAVVVVVAALGAAGFTGYRYGYSQGVLATSNRDSNSVIPFGMNPHGMPMHNFGYDRGFGRGDFDMMGRGMDFGFFSPIRFLLRLAFWALIAWAVYTLVTRSGWRLTRAQPAPVAANAPTAEPTPPAPSEEDQQSSALKD